MKKLLLSLITILLIISAEHVLAQSRMPEIKIEQRKEPVPDSLNFEERPYFLLIEQSEKALQEGKYDDAALRLIEAMSVEPDNELNVALMSNLGMIYFYNEQDSLALEVLDRAISRSPRLISPREGRARVLTSLGRDDEAYAEYGKIIDIDSLYTDARFVRGMMSLYRGDLTTAMADIDVLQRVVPLSRKTMLLQATMYSMTGREQEAVSLFRRVIDREPAPEYYARLVACLLALDDLEGASTELGKAMELYPRDAELYYYRAILNKKRYLPDEAHKDAKTAISLGADPDRVRAIFTK